MITGAFGTVWRIVGPGGETMTFTRSSMSSASVPQVWFLDGTLSSGIAGIWTSSGSLVGAPADGTWTINLEPTSYASQDSQGAASGRPSANLTIGGKTIIFGAHWQAPLTTKQLWNRHITTTTWTEPSTIPQLQAGFNDPINEASDEDPDNARYFQSATGVSTPTPATGGSTISCPSSTILEGSWLRGGAQSGNTYAYFAHIQGIITGDPDLRDNLLTESTTLTDKGSANSGTHTATIFYNNAVGHSYQLIARAGLTGLDQLGEVLYIIPGQCTLPVFDTSSNVEHDNNALDVSASNAQCNGDKTTFTVTMQDNPSGLQEHLLKLFIFDANQGGLNLPADPITVLFFNTTTMHRTATASEAHAHFISGVLPPGNYVAFAYSDYTGLGAVDYIDSDSFSVPVGACGETAITQILNLFNTTLNNFDFLNQSVHDHRNGTIEVSTMNNFNDLGFDGFLFLLFWIAALLFFTYMGWLVAAGFALPGLLDAVIPSLPFDFVTYLVLCLLGFVFEIAANRFSWGGYQSGRRRLKFGE